MRIDDDNIQERAVEVINDDASQSLNIDTDGQPSSGLGQCCFLFRETKTHHFVVGAVVVKRAGGNTRHTDIACEHHGEIFFRHR